MGGPQRHPSRPPGPARKRHRQPNGADYQEQITGAPPGTEYKVTGPEGNHVDFDGLDTGTQPPTLIEAKDRYSQFLTGDGEFQPWFTGQEGLLDEAARQIAAADGDPLRWVFSEQDSMDAFRDLFVSEGVDVDAIEWVVVARS